MHLFNGDDPISREEVDMAWLLLVIAGFFEIGWAVELKLPHGFSRLGPTILTLFFLVSSFFLLARAMKTIPLGTAYAVWTGIGTVGAAVFGIVLFGEAVSVYRICFIILILVGIIGLMIIPCDRSMR